MLWVAGAEVSWDDESSEEEVSEAVEAFVSDWTGALGAAFDGVVEVVEAWPQALPPRVSFMPGKIRLGFSPTT